MQKKNYPLLKKVAAFVATFFIYGAIATIGTWPLATHLTTHLPDRFNDAMLHSWNAWWVQEALQNGQFPYFTNYLFYPHGVELVTHNFAWFHILPSLFLSQFFNAITTYNLAVLLNLVICGVVAFWVAYKLVHDYRAAFIAGLIYMMWPYRVSRLDLPNLLATYWIPLFLLFLILTMKNGRYRDAVLAGICFALVGYARWQLLIPATIMGLIFFAFLYKEWLPPERRFVLARLVTAGITAIICLFPAALLLLSSNEAADNLAYGDSEEVLMSADALAYITPSALHPAFGETTAPWHDQYYFDREARRRRPAYIGLVSFLLVSVGIYYERRRSLPWLITAVTMMLLSLGPIMRVNGIFYESIPTLYRLFAPAGILELIRDPERFVMFVALPVAMLAAYGVRGWFQHHASWDRYGWVITAVLGSLIFFEYYSPQTVLRDLSNPPAFFSQIAAEPDEFALINLPLDDLKGSIYMYEQISHTRPMLQGNLSRIPPSAHSYIYSNPWLGTLKDSGEMSQEFPDVSRQLTNLAQDNIRYLIVHKNLVGQDRIDHWQHYLQIQPRFEDESVIIYTTMPEAGSDFTLTEEWAPNLGPLQTNISASCVHPNHVLLASIAWGLTEDIDQDLTAQIALIDENGNTAQIEQYELVEEWPTSQWPANSLAWGHYLIPIASTLTAGEYNIDITLSGEEEARTLDTTTIQPDICNLASVDNAVDANALFDDQLRLVEYEFQQEENQLTLNWYWRAERIPEAEYTMFVHIFSPETGIPVAQYDGQPRYGAYSTQHWQPGEVVDDQIFVSLAGVPEGNYGVAIGVYNLATGERLPLLNATGELASEDGRFILPEQVIIP